MLKAICSFILLKLWGWKIESVFPKNIKKSVIIVIPHTSNWDFPIGILLRPIIDLKTNFVGKKSLFRFPLGILMRALGGVAVDRSKHNNFVDAVVDVYNKHEQFNITLTPEGTRSKVTTLKSGFYFIALEAKVPIVCAKFDWGKKLLGFSDPFYPTGDYEADLPKILQYFKGITGRNPKNDFEITV
ncbi:MAG: lysophospholipid acyltransferase family protein [Saprospiraceae bacterium]|nr:lysophospholipid acyltransferase family protein [Saprospiraceae bacterium]